MGACCAGAVEVGGGFEGGMERAAAVADIEDGRGVGVRPVWVGAVDVGVGGGKERHAVLGLKMRWGCLEVGLLGRWGEMAQLPNLGSERVRKERAEVEVWSCGCYTTAARGVDQASPVASWPARA